MKNSGMYGAVMSKGNAPSTWDGPGLRYGARWIASAPEADQHAFLESLGEDALHALPFLFEFWAMPHQVPPDGDWRSWVIMGGRGAGKTRAGAEWVRGLVEGDGPRDPGRVSRVALVGETVDQVREVMIHGESGIIACCPPDRRPTYNASRKRLEWPNGAIAHVHTAFSPEGLRGPQFDAAWVDEFGCAALDRGTNQPNKFIDPKSSESRLPRYSTGARDGLIQKQYYKAMLSYWADPAHNPQSDVYAGPMLDMSRAFAWAWDTRPYPFFPIRDELWSDGANYAKGHWLTGRVSSRSLASVVAEICRRAGVADFDVSRLWGYVRGYVIGDVGEARAALEPLMLRFGFDAIERDGCLVFKMRDGLSPIPLDETAVALDAGQEGTFVRTREAEAEQSGRMRLRFVEADGDFDIVAEEAIMPDDATHAVATSELSMALTRGEGRAITERWLAEARVAREAISFALPPSRLDIGAGDVVDVPGEAGEGRALFRVDRVEQGPHQVLEAVRIAPRIYQETDLKDPPAARKAVKGPVPVTPLFMDLPLITGVEDPSVPHIAATSEPWPGSVAVYQSSGGQAFRLNSLVNGRSVVGVTETDLEPGCAGRFDRGDGVVVTLQSGTLEAVDEAALLAGANTIAIGDGDPDAWELFQFRSAALIGPKRYRLTGLLRGQRGSDHLAETVWAKGSYVVLMNGLPQQLDRASTPRSIAQTYRVGPAAQPYDTPSFVQQTHAFAGNGLRPYSPVHLRAVAAADGGYEVSWVRRTRIDGDNWELADVPLGEASERYHVDVLHAGSVVRSTTVTAPQWTYGVTQQQQDGVTGAVTFRVAQISDRFGPGVAATIGVDI